MLNHESLARPILCSLLEDRIGVACYLRRGPYARSESLTGWANDVFVMLVLRVAVDPSRSRSSGPYQGRCN